MRPQVSALVTKLRAMKMMSQLGTAEYVIYDLAYEFLYKTNQTDRLGRVALQIQSLWVDLMGRNKYEPALPPEYSIVDGHIVKVVASGIDPANYVPFVIPDPPVVDEGALVEGTQPNGIKIRVTEGGSVFVDARNHGLPDGEYQVGAPADSATVGDSPGEVLEAFLADPHRKDDAKWLMDKHFPVRKGYQITCGCGREFAAEEAWANHLRVRMWNLLKGKVEAE